MKTAAIAAFVFLSAMPIQPAAAQPASQLATEEFMIPAADPGVQL